MASPRSISQAGEDVAGEPLLRGYPAVSIGMAATRSDARLAGRVAIAMVACAILVLGFWRLDRYPATWFDEGMHLQVSRNLVERGTYASVAADGSRDYAPAVGVGPTLLLPIAAALKVGGNSLVVARLVPVLYLCLATLLLFLIARALFGLRVAALTVVLLVTLPALDWLETGRQALGEIPALAFLLLGGVLAIRARSRTALAAAGVVLGLAMVTKGQFLLVLPIALVCLALLDCLRLRHRPLDWHATLLVAALATWGAWIAALLLLIGDGQVVENIRLLRQSSGGALLVFDLERMRAASETLLGPGSFLLVAPAAGVGALAVRSASGERQFALAGLWIFQAIWLAWFTFASIGWPRYAAAGLAVNAIFMALLIVIVLARLRDRPLWRLPAPASASVAVVALAALIALGGWRTLAPLARGGEPDAARFASLVEATTPAGATIDGWEPEVGFLVDRPIQPPPPGSLDRAVRSRWLGQGQPLDLSGDLRGDYLVIGPFARWVGVYQRAAASPVWRRVAAVGPYELYQRVAGVGTLVKRGMDGTP